MRIIDLYRQSLHSAAKLKNLIIFFVLTHIVFFAFGQWMVAKGYPGVLELRAEQLRQIQELPYLKPLTGILADNLILKILYTFFFNLLIGAFLSTTLTGAIFFLPYVIAVWRSFLIGVLVSDIDVTIGMVLVFYGTFVLEFGAYCLSSAAGTDIGLSMLWPARKGKETVREGASAAFRNAMRLYFLVAIILFISAIWEITWLDYTGPLIKPGSLK